MRRTAGAHLQIFCGRCSYARYLHTVHLQVVWIEQQLPQKCRKMFAKGGGGGGGTGSAWS